MRNTKLKLFKAGGRDVGVLISAIVVGVFFSLTAPNFLTSYTIFTMLRQTAELGIVAMAMSMLIVGGEFDLSVGSIYAVVGVVTGLLYKNVLHNIWLSAGCALGIGLLLGAVNGLLVTKTGIHSFIGTLATMKVFRGVAMVLTGAQSVSGLNKGFFFEFTGHAKLFGFIPIPVLWLFVALCIFYFVMHRTSFGVKVYATGDNKEAAGLVGIRTDKIKRRCFLITAFAAGCASLISMGYLGTTTPSQGGGLELEAIAAAVIGGTSMNGGIGGIFGTFLGALIIAQVRTGLVLMGTNAYVQDALVGLLIAVSVVINVFISRKRR
ncbi:MAG: ABC transporter permease [Spartobacteria bacterium]|nr:ABC transporter permease [Spartobacteria bacterium]